MRDAWTLGELVDMLNVPEHRIQYLFRARKVPEVRRVGGRRVFRQGDVRRVAEALGVSCPRSQSKEKAQRQ